MQDLGKRGLTLKCKASAIKPRLLLATAKVVEVTAELESQTGEQQLN